MSDLVPDPTATLSGDAGADARDGSRIRQTWEVELLISGAIVVALFQLPGAVDGLFERVRPHLSGELYQVVWNLYFPAKMVITPVIVVFVVHILLRGLWVGLVGLNAVFPAGVDWSRVNVGPLVRSLVEPQLDNRRLELRVDRAASLLFAVLIALLGMLTTMGLWIAVGQLVALAVFAAGLVRGSVADVARAAYLVVMVALFLPLLLAGSLDKAVERWPALAVRAWPSWLVRTSFRLSSAMLALPLYYSVALTLQSNLSRRKPEPWRATLLGLVGGVALALAVFGPMVAGRLADAFDSYVYTPRPFAEAGERSAHYRSLTGEDTLAWVPTIQGDQLNEPFVRLYLPYDPWGDNARLAELCPDAEPFRRDGDLAAMVRRSDRSNAAKRRQVLACFARLWRVELNGTEVALDLLFADQPGGRGRGVVAYLATASLPAGRNDLLVTRFVTEAERARPRFEPDQHQFYIPFWKAETGSEPGR